MSTDQKTPFDSMFDFNRDGHLDRAEEACRDIYIMELMEAENEEEDEDEDDLDFDEYDFEDDF